MRWFTVTCVLATSFAIVLAIEDDHPKHKRDLSLVKNFIKKAIFGSEEIATLPPVVIQNEKIFRIPGFKNVLVKAVPKVKVASTVPEKVEVVQQDPNVAIVGSYLGTKTPAETLNALRGMKNLLQSGVLSAKREMIQNTVPVVAQPPYIKFISAIRKTETLPVPPILFGTERIYADIPVQRPVIYQMPKPMAVLSPLPPTPMLTTIPRPTLPIRPIMPMPIPTVVQTMTPIKVPVPVPTKYSYQQIHRDGQLSTYTAHDSQNVIVDNSNMPSPLPPFVTHRLHEVFNLGINGFYPGVPVPIVSAPIPMTITNFPVRPIQPTPIVSNNKYLYQQVHKDGLVSTYSGSGQRDTSINIIGEKIRPALLADRIEKVVAGTAFSNLPNSVVVTEQIGVPGYPLLDTRREDKIMKGYESSGAPGRFSYQSIHKDGTVTKYSGSATAGEINSERVMPIFPVVNRYTMFNAIEAPKVSPVSAGMFRYQIVHKNASTTTNSGIEKNIQNKYSYQQIHTDLPKVSANKPSATETPSKVHSMLPTAFHSNRVANIAEENGNSFSYSVTHNDGTVTKYGASLPTNKNDKKPNSNVLIKNNSAGTFYETTKQNGNVSPNSVLEMVTKPVIPKSNTEQLTATSPALIPDTGENIGKVNGNSFSYHIFHNDGTVTSFGSDKSGDHLNMTNFDSKNTLTQMKNVAPQVIHNPIATNNMGQITTQYIPSVTTVRLASNEKPVSFSKPINTDSFSYKAVHSDGSVTNYSNNGVKENTSGIATVIKDSNNGRVQQTINVKGNPNQNVQTGKLPSTSSSFTYKTIHSDGSISSHLEGGPAVSGQKNVQASRDSDRIQGISTNSPGLPTNSEFSYKHVSNSYASQDMYAMPVTPVGVAAVDAKAILFSKPVVSSYMYKQINHNMPNNFTVVKIEEPVREYNKVFKESNQSSLNLKTTGNENKQALQNSESVPHDYVYIPPANLNVPPPTKANSKLTVPSNYVYVPPPSANAPVPIKSNIVKEERPPVLQNYSDSLSKNPIVVMDQPMTYSYQQMKTDGSSINVTGGQSIVSVDLMPLREANSLRGDIPDLK